jgi:hypothetical protein
MILDFRLHAARYAVAVLDGDAALPVWPRGRFTAVVRTQSELTVVCEEGCVPRDVRQQGGWRCLEIAGTFGLDAVGVVATASRAIAEAGISLFAYSTWSADCLLIHDTNIVSAIDALRASGHTVR